MEIIESVFAAVLTPVFLIIGAGWAFNRVNAGGVTSEQARRVISALVMYIFYPALIFSVIPTIELDNSLGMAATFYAVSLCAGLSLAFLLTRILKSFGAPNADIGVVLLCAGLGNLISIGIPVVQHLLGEDGAGYAIATDIFVVTPFSGPRRSAYRCIMAEPASATALAASGARCSNFPPSGLFYSR